MDTVQKRVLLSGRVQGVGFRYFTRMNARDLNVKGWVKNRRDGKVEAVIQGSSDSIDELLERLRKGPGSAIVDEIKIENMEVDENFDSFNVRRW